MKNVALAISATAMALSFGSAGHAATIIGDTTISGVTLDFSPGAPLADMIKDRAVPNSTTLALITDSGKLVDFTAPTTLEHSGNGGFATVSGLGSGKDEQGFASLIIDPQAPADGFSKINFNVKVLGDSKETFYGDFILQEVGGGQIKFENVLLDGNGENKFGFSSNDNRLFSFLQLTGLSTLADGGTARKFESIRQVSIQLGNAPVTAVPEPTTWAMMILGVGLIGGAMRRRSRQNVRVRFGKMDPIQVG